MTRHEFCCRVGGGVGEPDCRDRCRQNCRQLTVRNIGTPAAYEYAWLRDTMDEGVPEPHERRGPVNLGRRVLSIFLARRQLSAASDCQ